MREPRKPKRKKIRLWCPGGQSTIPGVSRRKYVRCPSCDQRFLASEVPCCGSEMKVVDRHGPYKRWPETCAFPAYRVPKHKAF